MQPRIAIFLIILTALFGSACSEVAPDDARLIINIEACDILPATKFIGSHYGDESLSKGIKGLDILVFNSSTGELEKHVRIADAWDRTKGVPVSGYITKRRFSVNITEGRKDVLVIANSQHTVEQLDNYYRGGSTILYSDLSYEFPGFFTMYGYKSSVDVTSNTSIFLPLSRIVSRVTINKMVNSSQRDFNHIMLTFSNCCGNTAITRSGTLQGDNKNLWNNGRVDASNNKIFESQRELGELSFVTNNHLYQFPPSSLKKGKSFDDKIYFFMYPRSSASKSVKLTIECGASRKLNYYYLNFKTIEANTSYNIASLSISSDGSNNIVDGASTATKSDDNGWINCDLGEIVL